MQSDKEPVARPRRRIALSVESLEGRALMSRLSGLPMAGGTEGYGSPTPTPSPTPSPTPTPVQLPTTPTPTAGPTLPLPPSGAASTPLPARSPTGQSHGRHRGSSGIVSKPPQFYEAYTGPKLAELNAVKAIGKLARSGRFTFTGINQGRIDHAPAVYVWGIDRNGNLTDGPFLNRPNIKFDAVVTVTLDASLRPTAQVFDLASGARTDLPAGSVRIHGRKVRVTVPMSLLPSTGLAPAQYRFNYWPEDGGPPASSSVASFAPEFTTAPVGSGK